MFVVMCAEAGMLIWIINLSFQDLIEKVMVLRHAVRGQNHDMGGAASSKLAEYASLLASQGKLETALAYLPTASSDVSSNCQSNWNDLSFVAFRTMWHCCAIVWQRLCRRLHHRTRNKATSKIQTMLRIKVLVVWLMLCAYTIVLASSQQHPGTYQPNERANDVGNPYKQKRQQKNMYQGMEVTNIIFLFICLYNIHVTLLFLPSSYKYLHACASQ